MPGFYHWGNYFNCFQLLIFLIYIKKNVIVTMLFVVLVPNQNEGDATLPGVLI